MKLNTAGDLEVKVPAVLGVKQAQAFVAKHQQWITERVNAHQQQVAKRGQGLYYQGHYYPFKYHPQPQLELKEDALYLPTTVNSLEQIQALTEPWLRAQAREKISQVITQWWPEFAIYGTSKPVLRIKKMRTRWGSLSKKGYINMNLALVQVPPELLELVVVHELCHLKYFDHGSGFKALMSQHLPNWPVLDKQLDAFGRQVLE